MYSPLRSRKLYPEKFASNDSIIKKNMFLQKKPWDLHSNYNWIV